MSLARVDRKRPCPVTRSYHCFACAVSEFGLEAARKMFSKARAPLRLVKEYPMKPVQSSTIQRIGYDAPTQVLTIEFINGGTYEYLGVPADVFSALSRAESIGKFHAAHIKNKYTFKKLAAAKSKHEAALEFVLDEWNPKECNCDGAVDAPYACYFHRIEDTVLRALGRASR